MVELRKALIRQPFPVREDYGNMRVDQFFQTKIPSQGPIQWMMARRQRPLRIPYSASVLRFGNRSESGRNPHFLGKHHQHRKVRFLPRLVFLGYYPHYPLLSEFIHSPGRPMGSVSIGGEAARRKLPL